MVVSTEKTLTFPAVIICAWGTDYPLDKAIFYCQFNQQDCQLERHIDQVIVVGYGFTVHRYCIRFNGGSYESLLSIKNAGYSNGLNINFFLPEEVCQIN